MLACVILIVVSLKSKVIPLMLPTYALSTTYPEIHLETNFVSDWFSVAVIGMSIYLSNVEWGRGKWKEVFMILHEWKEI